MGPPKITTMQEIKDMNLGRLKAYASSHHDVTVGRGNENTVGLRNAIARAHIQGCDLYEEPTGAAAPDFRAHKFIGTMASRYTGLGKFEPSQVFSTVTTNASGVTSLGGGNNLLGGNLGKAVLEMPPTALTSRRGVDLPRGYTFCLTLFVAGNGTGQWRPVGNSGGGNTSDEPHRLCFQLKTPMHCSILGTKLNMLTVDGATSFSASLNNVSTDDEHSNRKNHVWNLTEFVSLCLNVPERGISCLKQAWELTIVGTLESLRYKACDRRAFDARVAQHTQTLLGDNEWLSRMLQTNANAHQKDVAACRNSDGKKLHDRHVFIKWFESNGAVCEVSELLINRAGGAFQAHFDRCCDNIDHTTRNCRAVCLIFCSTWNVSREQWLQLLLDQDQDLVQLTDDDRARVDAELKRLAENQMMTRKHAARTGQNAFAATEDDSRFSHR
jgi:hypothetical protein